jgi:hypothetical protein
MTPCSPAEVHRRLGGTYCHKLQVLRMSQAFLDACLLQISCLAYSCIPKMEAEHSFETSLNFYQITQRFHPVTQYSSLSPLWEPRPILTGVKFSPLVTFNYVFEVWGRGSSVGIATDYGLYDGGSILGRGNKFFFTPQRPHRFQCPPKLLSNGCRWLLYVCIRGGP